MQHILLKLEYLFSKSMMQGWKVEAATRIFLYSLSKCGKMLGGGVLHPILEIHSTTSQHYVIGT